jgi:hypothetical protein
MKRSLTRETAAQNNICGTYVRICYAMGIIDDMLAIMTATNVDEEQRNIGHTIWRFLHPKKRIARPSSTPVSFKANLSCQCQMGLI